MPLSTDISVDKVSIAGSGGRGPEDDVVIAVLGGTGTGKSSFVKLLTGDTSMEVGHKLQSQTSEVKVCSFQDPNTGRRVRIVDTPGFDDSRASAGITDTEVLKRIADFLLNEYDQNRKLTGLVYVTSITDRRFGGQSARNLRMFKSLCGSGTFKNVVVLTTFWDQITEKKGSEREAELKQDFFSALVEGGAIFMRHDHTIESALRVLAYIFSFTPSVVRIQEEIRVEGKSLENTEAGSLHREEVQRAIEEHNKQMAELREELDAVKQSNIIAKLQLELAQEKLQRNLDRWENERSELKRGLEEERKAREQQGERLAKKMEELRRGMDEGKAHKRKESRPVMEVYVVEEKDAVKSRKVAKPTEKESGVEWERVSRSQQEIKPAKMEPVVEKDKIYERKEAEPTKEEWPCTLQ